MSDQCSRNTISKLLYRKLAVLAFVLPLTAVVAESKPAVNLGLANPASVYCSFLGGQSHSTLDQQGGNSSRCLLSDGTSCEQWALYRGSCILDAQVSKPFAFCAAIGNSLLIPAGGSVQGESMQSKQVPEAILVAMRAQGVVSSEMPESLQAAARWRCMGAQVYVCVPGANLPCEEQADISRAATPAMQKFCKAKPNTDVIPAYVSGRATVFAWSCAGNAAITKRQILHADEQGYLMEFWHLLQEE